MPPTTIPDCMAIRRSFALSFHRESYVHKTHYRNRPERMTAGLTIGCIGYGSERCRVCPNPVEPDRPSGAEFVGDPGSGGQKVLSRLLRSVTRQNTLKVTERGRRYPVDRARYKRQYHCSSRTGLPRLVLR